MCVVITVAIVMLLRDFGPYVIFLNVCCYNRCHVVKGFWALRDNISESVYCYNRCHCNAVKGFWTL
jgi:hypothetical protein